MEQPCVGGPPKNPQEAPENRLRVGPAESGELGTSALAGLAVRAGSQLPWSVLRAVYTRIGASEGINPKRLDDVNLTAVAASFADRYPERRYPAVLLRSGNGTLTHLSAAMQVPWLPDTVLVPAAWVGDTDRPDQGVSTPTSVTTFAPGVSSAARFTRDRHAPTTSSRWSAGMVHFDQLPQARHPWSRFLSTRRSVGSWLQASR